jgi:hypothetical protein
VRGIRWVAIALLLGCQSESVLGPGDVIVGRWGGLGVEIQGSRAGLAVTLSCDRTATAGPVRINADKTFVGTAELRVGSAAPSPVAFIGHIVSDHSLYVEFGDPVIAYATLAQGQRGSFWTCAAPPGG